MSSEKDTPVSPAGEREGANWGKIQVFCRVRPVLEGELDLDNGIVQAVTVDSDGRRLSFRNGTSYEFHGAFSGECEQNDIYRTVGIPTIDNIFAGYPGTVLVYGQTGTGKSFTLCETREGQEGVIIACMREIFRRMALPREGNDAGVFTLEMTYLQLYRDKLQDLLNPTASNVEMTSEGGVQLHNVERIPIASFEDFNAAFERGSSHKIIASTAMNPVSSRSHCVLLLYLSFVPAVAEGMRFSSKLTFIDLAGYERFTKTGVTSPTHVAEAQGINRSLLALGTVVSALANRKSHVPWRDSRLTRLLQDSIGGASRCSIICTVGPSSVNLQESTDTVRFGLRAMIIRTSAAQSGKVDYQRLCKKLQEIIAQRDRTIEKLENQLREASHIPEDVAEGMQSPGPAFVDGDHANCEVALIEAAEADLASLAEMHLAQLAQAQLDGKSAEDISRLQAQQSGERGLLEAQHNEEIERLAREREGLLTERFSKVIHDRVAKQMELENQLAAATSENSSLLHLLDQMRSENALIASKLAALRSQHSGECHGVEDDSQDFSLDMEDRSRKAIEAATASIIAAKQRELEAWEEKCSELSKQYANTVTMMENNYVLQVKQLRSELSVAKQATCRNCSAVEASSSQTTVSAPSEPSIDLPEAYNIIQGNEARALVRSLLDDIAAAKALRELEVSPPVSFKSSFKGPPYDAYMLHDFFPAQLSDESSSTAMSSLDVFMGEISSCQSLMSNRSDLLATPTDAPQQHAGSVPTIARVEQYRKMVAPRILVRGGPNVGKSMFCESILRHLRVSLFTVAPPPPAPSFPDALHTTYVDISGRKPSMKSMIARVTSPLQQLASPSQQHKEDIGVIDAFRRLSKDPDGAWLMDLSGAAPVNARIVSPWMVPSRGTIHVIVFKLEHSTLQSVEALVDEFIMPHLVESIRAAHFLPEASEPLPIVLVCTHADLFKGTKVDMAAFLTTVEALTSSAIDALNSSSVRGTIVLKAFWMVSCVVLSVISSNGGANSFKQLVNDLLGITLSVARSVPADLIADSELIVPVTSQSRKRLCSIFSSFAELPGVGSAEPDDALVEAETNWAIACAVLSLGALAAGQWIADLHAAIIVVAGSLQLPIDTPIVSTLVCEAACRGLISLPPGLSLDINSQGCLGRSRGIVIVQPQVLLNTLVRCVSASARSWLLSNSSFLSREQKATLKDLFWNTVEKPVACAAARAHDDPLCTTPGLLGRGLVASGITTALLGDISGDCTPSAQQPCALLESLAALGAGILLEPQVPSSSSVNGSNIPKALLIPAVFSRPAPPLVLDGIYNIIGAFAGVSGCILRTAFSSPRVHSSFAPEFISRIVPHLCPYPLLPSFFSHSEATNRLFSDLIFLAVPTTPICFQEFNDGILPALRMTRRYSPSLSIDGAVALSKQEINVRGFVVINSASDTTSIAVVTASHVGKLCPSFDAAAAACRQVSALVESELLHLFSIYGYPTPDCATVAVPPSSAFQGSIPVPGVESQFTISEANAKQVAAALLAPYSLVTSTGPDALSSAMVKMLGREDNRCALYDDCLSALIGSGTQLRRDMK